MGELKFPIRKVIRKEYPDPIPGLIAAPFIAKKESHQKFKRIIEKKGSETEAHKALLRDPALLRYLTPGTGHHGIWYANKPNIRPKLINGKPGKIPDFILVGRGSGGLEWFIVELKSPSDSLFNRKGDAFSTAANKGLCQLGQYLYFAHKEQAYVSSP